MVERRLTFLAAIVLLWGAAILKNLISLQVVHHREYAVRARSIQEVVEDIPAPRGTIFDRDGRPLAMSLASRTVFINPMKVDVGVASDLLGYLLHLDRSELYLKIKQAADAHRGYLMIKRQLSPEEYDNLLNLKSRIDWVSLSHESQRHYPNGTLAAHVLGSVDFEEKGNAGIEKGLDKELRGTPGRIRLLTDVHRRGIAPQTTIPAKPGTSLTLTLDERLQFVAEREIAAAVHRPQRELRQRRGDETGYRRHPGDGQLSRPSIPMSRWSAAQSTEAPHEPCLQRSVRARLGVQGDHLLGGARNHQPAPRNPHQLQRRRPHAVQPHDSRFPRRHVGRPDGERASPSRATSARSRSGFKVGQKHARLHEALRLRPEDRPAAARRIARQGVPAGAAGARRRWRRCRMGQEVSVTTVQLAQAASVVANGGMLVKPRLVLKRGDRVEPVAAPVRVLKPETAITMRQMMEGVVLHGTGSRARLAGYSSGGKTGSAQIYDYATKHYTHTYNGSFMGFAPVTNPQVVVVVTLNGTHGEVGFRRAGRGAGIQDRGGRSAARAATFPRTCRRTSRTDTGREERGRSERPRDRRPGARGRRPAGRCRGRRGAAAPAPLNPLAQGPPPSP